MKTTVANIIAMVVLCGGMLSNAASQIQMNANSISFRDNQNATRYTYHYGDLKLFGGNHYDWGWLWCNKLYVVQNPEYASIIEGDLNVTGNLLVYNSKHFVHPHPTDAEKAIKYVSAESGEALTLTRGRAKTVNGEVTIALPEHFSLVTSNTVPVTVIVTPRGAPVLLYTKEESKDKIVVAMRKSDFTEFRDVEFAYQVTGVRDGFENQEVIVDAENLGTPESDEELTKNDVKKRIKAIAQKMEQRSMKKESGVKEEKK